MKRIHENTGFALGQTVAVVLVIGLIASLCILSFRRSRVQSLPPTTLNTRQ